MENFKVDILGKAPSLAEIEMHNKYSLNKFRINIFFSLFILISAVSFIVLWGGFLASPFEIIMVEVVAIISAMFGVIMISHTAMEGVQKESFMESNGHIDLLNLAIKFPEIALYRNQVIMQGREFLQSEYDACMVFANKKKLL